MPGRNSLPYLGIQDSFYSNDFPYAIWEKNFGIASLDCNNGNDVDNGKITLS